MSNQKMNCIFTKLKITQMLKKSLFLFVLASCLFSLKTLLAQDIHYSQYYASPLTLNPALTGKFNGYYRATAIYRDQWRNVNGGEAVFMTPSASVDFSLLKDKLSTDALGVGAHVVFDKDGIFERYQAGVNLAYHKGLDAGNKYHLAFGLQGVYNSSSLDVNSIFADQIGLDGTIADMSMEQTNGLASSTNSFFDVNAGLLFDAKINSNITMYVGGSFLHITRPLNDFISTGSDEDNALPRRYVGHGGLDMQFNRFYVLPGFLFQINDIGNQEVNFGSTFGYDFAKDPSKDLIGFLGAWYRMGDAAIIKGGLEYNRIRLSAAYDLTLSQLRDDTNVALGKIPTAFEISMSYFGFNNPKVPQDRYLFNPRF